MSTTRRESRAWKTKHGRILAAALDEFVASGFDGASMDRIAARADVSKVTIYNHFRNKDELYEEVLGVHLKAVEEADLGLKPTDGEAVEAGLNNFCRRFLAVMLEPETIGLTRLVALESFRRPADAKSATRLATRPPYAIERLDAYLTRHVEAGRLSIPPGVSTLLAARQLVGMLLENSFHPRLWGVQAAKPAEDAGGWNALIDASVKMFLGYYGSARR